MTESIQPNFGIFTPTNVYIGTWPKNDNDEH